MQALLFIIILILLQIIKSTYIENDNKELVLFNEYIEFINEKDYNKSMLKVSTITNVVFQNFDYLIKLNDNNYKWKKSIDDMDKSLNENQWSLDDVKWLIDWTNVKVNFEDLETAIIKTWNNLKHILLANDLTKRGNQISLFLEEYKSLYNEKGYILFNYLINIEENLSENVFKAAQVATEYDRKQVQNFMMSNTVLLTQAMQIEAAYIKLKYNNDKANEYIQSTWDKRMNVLKEKMDEIDQQTKNQYSSQYQIDLDKLLKSRYILENRQFLEVAFRFLTKKYYWRDWFVLTYAELSGFRDHTVSTCRGTHRFRQNGRNIIVSSIESETEADNALRTRNEKEAIIGSYNGWSNNHEYSLGWVNYIRGRLPYCNQADTIASVAWGSNVWYMNTRLVVYKKNCVYGKSPCYNTFIFG